MIDLVAVKKAIKTGELTVYESGGYVYMESKAREKIVLMKKEREENGTAAD